MTATLEMLFDEAAKTRAHYKNEILGLAGEFAASGCDNGFGPDRAAALTAFAALLRECSDVLIEDVLARRF